MATPHTLLELSFSDSYCLTDLPTEVLERILGYLPLKDLANIRLVCSGLQALIDAECATQLWANVPLDGLWLSPDNRAIVQRAADSGNVEVLIMLAFAYLYAEGIPEQSDKAAMISTNGEAAAKYLTQAEKLTRSSQPFSWVLIRPPWAPVCFKASAWRYLRDCCHGSTEKEVATGLHYSVGRALGFCRHEVTESVEDANANDSLQWFEAGAELNCPYSALEVWKKNCKPNLMSESIHSIRWLREIVSLKCDQDQTGRYWEAQFELCSAYARGYYGGFAKQQALQYIRQTFASAVPIISQECSLTASSMPRERRYILVDWLVEVVTLKDLPSCVLHLAVNLTDRYLQHQAVERKELQLLGITAILLASRWMGESIISIREASWFTDHTYTYEQVVRMMGRIVACLQGDIRRTTVHDYLLVLFDLLAANTASVNMATYLSEAVLLHTVFGRFTAAQLAASCLLSARLLLGLECPWPSDAVLATGYQSADLQKCCVTIYDRCLTDKFEVIDYRNIKLHAVTDRHSMDRSGVMSCSEFKDHLGVTLFTSPAVPLMTPAPKLCRTNKQTKVFSFLSESCYLSTPSPSSLTPHEATGLTSSSSGGFVTSESSSGDSSPNFATYPESFTSGSPLELNLSPSELDHLSLHSALSCSSTSHSLLFNGVASSNFPQPSFSDCELTPSPNPKQQRSPLPRGANALILDLEEGHMEVDQAHHPSPCNHDNDEDGGVGDGGDDPFKTFSKPTSSSPQPSGLSQSKSACCLVSGPGTEVRSSIITPLDGDKDSENCPPVLLKAKDKISGEFGSLNALSSRSALQPLHNLQEPFARSTPESQSFKSRQQRFNKGVKR